MKENDIRIKETISPKTPGGISKTHLTPIRRLGLSRKWKKSGGTFVSPLTPKSDDGLVVVEEKSRKRRLCVEDENINSSPPISKKNYDESLVSTPTSVNDGRTPKVSFSRKKSKIISSFNENINTYASEQNRDVATLSEKSESTQIKEIDEVLVDKKCTNNIINDTPQIVVKSEKCTDDISVKEVKDVKLNVVNDVNELKVPNNLTKECIVVIQNKILQPKNVENEYNASSEVMFDSDSDDVPLSHINNKKSKENLDNNDFAISKSRSAQRVQPLKKSDSVSSSKSTKSSKKKNKPEKDLVNKKVEVSSSTQSSNSFDDDDDEDFVDNKKTILISKSYDKVAKPFKARSTGSITQKDIDELKARIETKKRHLFAKAMSEDTEELRGLIKKWQKGCQDALMELLELMKKKLPDRAHMDHLNILQMLKIPPALVGYDAENDCFNTPDDNSILAATFNDL